MDAQISAWNATQTNAATATPHSPDWLVDPARLLTRLAGNDITKATGRAQVALRTGSKGGRPPGHPDVVAQLMFGTWRFLLPDNDSGRQRLWTDAIHRAFPHLADPPAVLVNQIDGIYRLRNRVAHLEPILRTGLIKAQLAGIRAVLSAIDPTVEAWFTSRQRITATLKARP